jgi:hypothetical protein
LATSSTSLGGHSRSVLGTLSHSPLPAAGNRGSRGLPKEHVVLSVVTLAEATEGVGSGGEVILADLVAEVVNPSGLAWDGGSPVEVGARRPHRQITWPR